MPLILAGLILLFGSVVQGAIGFALGMIAVPLLVDAGYSLSQAVALSTLAIGIQVMAGAWQLRDHIPWSEVKLAALVRYVTVPVGIALLLLVEDVNGADVKPLVGIGVLIGVAVRLAAPQQLKRNLPLPLSVAAFAVSGVLQGLVAMGGPPLVLWMTTRDFRARQARAFTMTLFLLNAPVQVLLLLFFSRTMSVDVVATALLLSPLIYLGTTIGVRAGNRINKLLLNRLALAVLIVIAFNAIF
ncbi:MAG: sulfite exporter TauE/SafE family protein [Chloroflexi bacterium]|nr:sulfite exporter TauE/SafE family protein [Chloroflexota bacterium]